MSSVNELQVKTFRAFDALGSLVAVQANKDIPISIERVFYIYGTPGNIVRGEHAHRECTQVLVCLNGGCVIVCDDGFIKKTFHLTQPNQYLYIPPGIWASEKYTTKDTVLMVFADKPYNPSEYVKDYQEFLNWKQGLLNEKEAA